MGNRIKKTEKESNIVTVADDTSKNVSGIDIEQVATVQEKIISTVYIYNDLDQLIKSVETTDGKSYTTSYEYDRNVNGIKICYFYEGNVLLYTTDGEGNKTSQNIIGPEGNTIASVRYDDGQKVYFYSKDIQGSTSVITDDGVFLSQDTYRGEDTESATWNLYGYCAENPIKYADPSGHGRVIVSGGVYSKKRRMIINTIMNSLNRH